MSDGNAEGKIFERLVMSNKTGRVGRLFRSRKAVSLGQGDRGK